MVTYTYESWLALQQTLRFRLDGKLRWLNVVKSDAELLELSGCTLDTIRLQAQDILTQINSEPQTQSAPNTKKRKTANRHSDSPNHVNLMTHLFAAYDATDDILSRCAIAYLIKNGCKIPEAEEDPKKFSDRIHRKQKEIERLEDHLQARLPKGR